MADGNPTIPTEPAPAAAAPASAPAQGAAPVSSAPAAANAAPASAPVTAAVTAPAAIPASTPLETPEPAPSSTAPKRDYTGLILGLAFGAAAIGGALASGGSLLLGLLGAVASVALGAMASGYNVMEKLPAALGGGPRSPSTGQQPGQGQSLSPEQQKEAEKTGPEVAKPANTPLIATGLAIPATAGIIKGIKNKSFSSGIGGAVKSVTYPVGNVVRAVIVKSGDELEAIKHLSRGEFAEAARINGSAEPVIDIVRSVTGNPEYSPIEYTRNNARDFRLFKELAGNPERAPTAVELERLEQFRQRIAQSDKLQTQMMGEMRVGRDQWNARFQEIQENLRTRPAAGTSGASASPGAAASAAGTGQPSSGATPSAGDPAATHQTSTAETQGEPAASRPSAEPRSPNAGGETPAAKTTPEPAASSQKPIWAEGRAPRGGDGASLSGHNMTPEPAPTAPSRPATSNTGEAPVATATEAAPNRVSSRIPPVEPAAPAPVHGEGAMTPRQPGQSAAYSVSAEIAETARRSAPTGSPKISGANLAMGSVGVGFGAVNAYHGVSDMYRYSDAPLSGQFLRSTAETTLSGAQMGVGGATMLGVAGQGMMKANAGLMIADGVYRTGEALARGETNEAVIRGAGAAGGGGAMVGLGSAFTAAGVGGGAALAVPLAAGAAIAYSTGVAVETNSIYREQEKRFNADIDALANLRGAKQRVAAEFTQELGKRGMVASRTAEALTLKDGTTLALDKQGVVLEMTKVDLSKQEYRDAFKAALDTKLAAATKQRDDNRHGLLGRTFQRILWFGNSGGSESLAKYNNALSDVKIFESAKTELATAETTHRTKLAELGADAERARAHAAQEKAERIRSLDTDGNGLNVGDLDRNHDGKLTKEDAADIRRKLGAHAEEFLSSLKLPGSETRITFSGEAITGEPAPAATPATSVAQAQGRTPPQ